MALDLREIDHQAIFRLANEALPTGSQIWVYGSRVKGTSHNTSDLDLVVHLPDANSPKSDVLNNSALTDFTEALSDSNIPIIIQVLAWQRIPEQFRENILKKYIVLWSN